MGRNGYNRYDLQQTYIYIYMVASPSCIKTTIGGVSGFVGSSHPVTPEQIGSTSVGLIPAACSSLPMEELDHILQGPKSSHDCRLEEA